MHLQGSIDTDTELFMLGGRSYEFAVFIIILLKSRKKETNYLKSRKEKNIFRPLLDCMIVFAVLSGLFFSSAEGIRLLPFPEHSAGSIDGVPGVSETSDSRYSPAVRTTNSKYSAVAKSKQNQRFDADSSAATAARISLAPNWSAVPEQHFSPEFRSVCSFIADLHPGRGPPLV